MATVMCIKSAAEQQKQFLVSDSHPVLVANYIITNMVSGKREELKQPLLEFMNR